MSDWMCSFRTTAEIRQPHPLWPPSLCGYKRSIFCSTAQMIYSCPRRPQRRTSVASNICRAVKRIEMNLLCVLRLILTRPALCADTPFVDLLLLQYQKFVVHYVTVRCYGRIRFDKMKERKNLCCYYYSVRAAFQVYAQTFKCTVFVNLDPNHDGMKQANLAFSTLPTSCLLTMTVHWAVVWTH